MGIKIISFIKKETILCVSLLLAATSAFFVRPDNEYINYVDWHTLMLLFSLMAVMAGLQRLGVFRKIGVTLLSHTKNTRQLALILVFLPFFFSMLITNDVALITFVPFALIVLTLANMESLLVPIVILQTIAANLGSMLTPMGNPQNLYLFSQSQMSLADFITLMLPYTTIAALCLFIINFLFKKKRIAVPDMKSDAAIPRALFFMYLILFSLCLLCVLDIIDVRLLAAIIIIFLIVFDRKIFASIDYSLLGTFIGFFIFIGNMGRLPQFHNFIERLIIGNEAPVAILSSQLISNVPSALLLSGFTDNWSALIIGTNLGGLGTLIASMASLISYKQIARNYPGKKTSYLIWFTIANIIMLAILFTAYLFLK
ncbi:MAG: SLC13 family permease [Clostridium sp.]|nr:SLC13 family permease [Clostridium sp.]MCM1172946.1 SLC13 family permease [Clostridium sp.]MCM1208933.1 SLC13 family permease [Ruminococcus sp.]